MFEPNLTLAWLDSWIVGVTESVALAATATLGYLFGRRLHVRRVASGSEQPHWELQRAASIAQNLENIAAQVRQDLAAHHSSVSQFKSRLAQMSAREDASSCKALYEEAERVLAPTLKLAAVLSHAYDRIRQQSAQLLTFTEGRIDPLTGTSNRRALDEQLKLLFEMLCRDGRPFSLAIFDIDHFKDINDRQGLTFGDQVLQDVARLLEQSVRDTDFVARYGGEEFVVVMPQTRLAGASVFAERLRGAIEQQLSVTVSGGIAEAVPQDTIQAVLSRADSAMYSAKAAGRNAVFQHSGLTIRLVAKQVSLTRDAVQDDVVHRDGCAMAGREPFDETEGENASETSVSGHVACDCDLQTVS
jgi:diguanylate cyclase (GGDEF)-like protein